MTRTNLAFVGAALAALGFNTGCHVNIHSSFGETLVGSGVAATEIRETDPFTGIEVSGSVNVVATIGESLSVKVSGDDNIVPLITTKVSNGILKIQPERNVNLDTKEPLTVTIVAAQLVSAEVSGACDVEMTGLAGADFSVDLSGASKLKLSGECEQLTADISGASTFIGESMKAKNAKVDLSGASNARIYASESIDGESSGASTLRYRGDPAKTKIDSSGASTIMAE
jgi:hypothetical protein